MTTPLSCERTVMDPATWTLAGVYAEALADCVSPKDAPVVDQQLSGLATMFDEIEGAKALLVGGALRTDERVALITQAVAGRVTEPVEALLVILTRNGRLGLLGALARRFEEVRHTRAGRVEVAVRSAVPLEDTDLQSLSDALAQTLGAPPVLRTEVAPDLLGGLTIQVENKVYDASVAGQFRKLRDTITAGMSVQTETPPTSAPPDAGSIEEDH